MAKDKPLIPKENFIINRSDLFARLVYLYKFCAKQCWFFLNCLKNILLHISKSEHLVLTFCKHSKTRHTRFLSLAKQPLLVISPISEKRKKFLLLRTKIRTLRQHCQWVKLWNQCTNRYHQTSCGLRQGGGDSLISANGSLFAPPQIPFSQRLDLVQGTS